MNWKLAEENAKKIGDVLMMEDGVHVLAIMGAENNMVLHIYREDGSRLGRSYKGSRSEIMATVRRAWWYEITFEEWDIFDVREKSETCMRYAYAIDVASQRAESSGRATIMEHRIQDGKIDSKKIWTFLR